MKTPTEWVDNALRGCKGRRCKRVICEDQLTLHIAAAIAESRAAAIEEAAKVAASYGQDEAQNCVQAIRQLAKEPQ